MPLLTRRIAERKYASLFFRSLDLALHPARHANVVFALAHPTLRSIKRTQRRAHLKYLRPTHLVRGLSTSQRAAAITHHYVLISKLFSQEHVDALSSAGVPLWEHETLEGRLQIRLMISYPTDNEGEVTLEFCFEDKLLAVCSFTFVPGSIINTADDTIIAVTRLQGSRDHFECARLAMRSMYGLSSTVVLFAALEGIAQRLGLTKIAGVAGEKQVCWQESRSAVFKSAYDDFFTSIGGVRDSSCFFQIPVPHSERPICEVKSSNRSRYRKQRDLKRRILNTTRQRLQVLHEAQ